MIIDAHVHINYNDITINNIIKYLDNNKIEGCWLLTWEELFPKQYYINLSIEDVYDAYLQYPSRIIPMYAPDPNRPNAPELLEHWVHKGICGCAELKVTLNWQSKKVRDLLSKVSTLRIPLVFHMEQSYRYFTFLPSDKPSNVFFVRFFKSDRLFGINKKLSNFLMKYYPPFEHWKNQRTFFFPGYMLDFVSLESALTDFPCIDFIAHGQLFWKHISSDVPPDFYPTGPVKREGLVIDLLRNYPNLYADISGTSGSNALHRDLRFTKKFLSEFSHKILFGTDNAELNQISFLKSLSLSQYNLNRIFYDNASHLLNKAYA
jgi:predicted TIM-barrel fold metal-dependent hydrolase